MGGLYLTDDLADPNQWQVPDGVTLGVGEFLVFWADDDTEQGPTHTNFKLGAGGEEIGLYDIDGVSLLDSIVFPEQTEDASYGRFPDGLGRVGRDGAADAGRGERGAQRRAHDYRRTPVTRLANVQRFRLDHVHRQR